MLRQLDGWGQHGGQGLRAPSCLRVTPARGRPGHSDGVGAAWRQGIFDGMRIICCGCGLARFQGQGSRGSPGAVQSVDLQGGCDSVQEGLPRSAHERQRTWPVAASKYKQKQSPPIPVLVGSVTAAGRHLLGLMLRAKGRRRRTVQRCSHGNRGVHRIAADLENV